MERNTQAIATHENRGVLPIGWQSTTLGRVVARSLTAYQFEVPAVFLEEGEPALQWVSFDRIHGKPPPAMPLVRF